MSGHAFDQSAESEAVRLARAEHEATDASPAAALAARRPEVIGPAGLASLQRLAGNQAVSELVEQERSPVLDVVSGGGAPLDTTVRGDMEARLGADFGDVRVHTDAAAHDSAVSVGARAYTVGSHVVFQRHAWDPSSRSGQTTLAHELTHVVQQRSGPVDGTSTGDGVSVSDPSDRFERAAAENAERVMSGPALTVPVQREGEEEEELQGSFVQREGDEEELQGDFVQREESSEEDESLQGSFVQREGEEEYDEVQ